jgi:hypothetical protein
MTQVALVRHPLQKPSESRMGWLLRLSEKNGYMSPWALYRLAGINRSEIRSFGVAAEKLADRRFDPITNLHERLSLGGHPIAPRDLRRVKPLVCPICISELGIIEAHWDLYLMIGCPIHKIAGLVDCPKCGKNLRWFRPGLLECDCNADLTNAVLPKLEGSEAALLVAIRCKVLRLAPSQNSTFLPLKHLLSMNLRTLLLLLRTLAKYRLSADRCESGPTPRQVIEAAARVLANWPMGFISLMRDLGRELPHDAPGGIASQFQSIYRSLFRNKAFKRPREIDFVRAAFLDFAVNSWGRGYVDPQTDRHTRWRKDQAILESGRICNGKWCSAEDGCPFA